MTDRNSPEGYDWLEPDLIAKQNQSLLLEALKAIWEEVLAHAEETGRELISRDTADQVRAAIAKASPKPRDVGRVVPKHGSGP